jgi:acyl carrier protein
MGTSPTRDAVKERLSCLLNEIAGIPRERITDTARVDGDLQMPSVVFVELQIAAEEEFDITIDPLRIVELNEFASLVDYVHECATGEGNRSRLAEDATASSLRPSPPQSHSGREVLREEPPEIPGNTESTVPKPALLR